MAFGRAYAHGHERGVSALLDVLPTSAHARVMAGNALDRYLIY
jgi:hypothetical protein